MKVSVVAPVRDEEATLPVLLQSLLNQSLPPDEVVLVDGGSRDRTAEVAASYRERGVRVIAAGPAFPGRGRNLGAAAARNDWIAFIDAGCTADADWLRHLAAEASTAPAGPPEVVLGSCRVRQVTEWEKAQALTFSAPIDPTTGRTQPFIASSLVHRSAWKAVGGFREDLRAAEDLLFFDSLGKAGVRVTHAPAAVVVWSQPAGPWGSFRRFRLYSRHHLAAALFGTWHLRVMAMDLALVGLALIGLRMPQALLAAGGLALARILSTVLKRRRSIAPAAAFRPDRLLRVALLLALADAALWLGSIDWLLGKATGPPSRS